MSELLVAGESTRRDLKLLRGLTGENCQPSPESIEELQSADLVLMSGQFVGAGKSTFIKALESQGRANIASWTNRDLRPDEVEGIDKCQQPLAVMVTRATSGYFLELEEVRPGCFYATPSEFTPGKSYVKDLELKGALRLRTFAPELPIIVPLPPLHEAHDKKVSEWERRVVSREGLMKAIGSKAIGDLADRLTGVIEEVGRVLELDLINDPHTLLVVNDDLLKALAAMDTFLRTGEKLDQEGLEFHLRKLRSIATTSLQTV